MLKKYYHWIVMVSCCLLTAASVGILINSYGVMYSPLAAKLGVGRGTATLHATIKTV